MLRQAQHVLVAGPQRVADKFHPEVSVMRTDWLILWTAIQAVAVTITLGFIAVQAYAARSQITHIERAAAVERTIALLERAVTLRLSTVMRRLRREPTYAASGEALLARLEADEQTPAERQSSTRDDVELLYGYFLTVQSYNDAHVIDRDLFFTNMCGDVIRCYLLLRPILRDMRPWAWTDFRNLAHDAQEYMGAHYGWDSETELIEAVL